MAINIVHEDEYAKAYFDTDLKAGIIIWKDKKIKSENYRLPLNVMIDYSAKYGGFEFYVSDTRLQSVISPEDRKWFEKELIPQAITNGVKRSAVIISGNVFKKHYLNMIIKASGKFAIDIKVFSDYDKAINWVKSYL